MSNYGILFDLDGTLWDSAEHVATAWNEVFETHPGLSLKLTADDIHGVMGMLLPDIAKKLLPDMPDEERTELFQRAMDNEKRMRRPSRTMLIIRKRSVRT